MLLLAEANRAGFPLAQRLAEPDRGLALLDFG